MTASFHEVSSKSNFGVDDLMKDIIEKTIDIKY